MALRLPRFLTRATVARVPLRERIRHATAKVLPFRRLKAEAPETDTARRALMVGTLSTAAVVPLPAFGGGGGGDGPITQALLDSYRAWLFFERRYLDHAMEQAGFTVHSGIFAGNPGGKFHAMPDEGPLHRAAIVLQAVGCDVSEILASEDGRRVAATGTPHPDAYLIACGLEYDEAATAARAAQDDFAARIRAYSRENPPTLDALEKQDGSGTYWTARELRRYLAGEPVHWAGGMRRRATAFDGDDWAVKLLGIAQEFEARDNAAMEAHGIAKADARLKDTAESALEIGEEIAGMKAHTLDGLAAKARVLQSLDAQLGHWPRPEWAGALALDVAAGVVGLARLNGTPDVPPASPAAKVDPVFAVIRAHRDAYRAFDDAVGYHSAVETRGSDRERSAEEIAAEERVAATTEAEADAFAALVACRPTTPGGLRALLSYLRGTARVSDGMIEQDELRTLLDTIAALASLFSPDF